MKTVWKEKEPVLDNEQLEKAREIAEECMIPETVARIAMKRGCESVDQVMAYLDPSPEDFYDPFGLPDMEKAVERILSARDKGETICIYGDYDVDGTTAVSMLKKYFDQIEINCFCQIPNRLKEGYGLNIPAVDRVFERGANLLLTVDNGISSIKEVEHAVDLGMDVIVTDHHECQEEIPKAAAVIDAKRESSRYPFKELCGAGIALKLIQALETKVQSGVEMMEYVECAAMATVADVVPLRDENRVITSLGIQSINQGPLNPGIAALKAVSEVEEVTAGRIGFILAPKINAAGRLGDAERIVDLYDGKNPEKIMKTAVFLRDENARRQDIEKEIFDAAKKQIEDEQKWKNVFVIASGEGWHSGVIGIAASRLQEIWYHPMIVIGIDEDGIGKGSCRSVEGLNLFKALSSCSDLFIKFGGHAQAAGFSIKAEKIPELQERLESWAEENDAERWLVKTNYYDDVLDVRDCTWELIDGLSMCEPYGVGNPGPVFRFNAVHPENIRKMGSSGDHLSFTIGESGMRCVAFGFGSQLEKFDVNSIDLLARPKKNVFNGNESIELELSDFKSREQKKISAAAAAEELLNDNRESWLLMRKILSDDFSILKQLSDQVGGGQLIPSRQQQIAVYRLMKIYNGKSVAFDAVRDRIENINSFQLLTVLETLKEIDIIDYKLKKGTIFPKICQTNRKKDVNNASLMIKLKENIN